MQPRAAAAGACERLTGPAVAEFKREDFQRGQALSRLLVLVCCSAGDGGAQEQRQLDESRLKFLLSPVERLASLNRRSRAEPQEIWSALDEACGALRALSEDRGFEDLMHFYQEQQYNSDISPEISALYGDFDRFVEFLKIERGLLTKYLSEEAVDEILGRVVATRKQAQNFKIDPDAIMSRLNETKEALCSAAQDFQGSVEREERNYLVGRGFLALAGALAASVDVVFGPTPPAVVSGTTGLFLIWMAS